MLTPHEKMMLNKALDRVIFMLEGIRTLAVKGENEIGACSLAKGAVSEIETIEQRLYNATNCKKDQ